MAKNVYGKKKTTRNILIVVIAAVVIAAAIFLAVALQKDGAGMNCFQRKATAASADGVKATVAEYKTMFDTITSNYANSTLTDEQIRNLQENSARETLIMKIYEKEAKALGLTLTEEQITSSEKSTDNQLASIEKSYADNLIQNGSYSKTALDKQVNSFYQRLGMSKNEYRAFVLQSIQADYYRQAIAEYYEQNGSGIDEAELVDFYRKSVEETMTTKDEDGTEKPAYQEGQFWSYLMMYQYGYSPMLYVPEGFIYIDFIKLEKGTAEEIMQIIDEVTGGDRDFDELMNSDENKNPYRNLLKGPYPIAEKDHSGLYTSDGLFANANALEIGQIGSFVEEPTTDADGNATYTGYLFRRAEGNMCYDGDHGVIKLDYFDGIKASEEEQYRLKQWLSDLKFEDAVYAYQGALK